MDKSQRRYTQIVIEITKCCFLDATLFVDEKWGAPSFRILLLAIQVS